MKRAASMKHILIVLCVVFLCSMVTAIYAFADDDIASGKYNGANWRISSSGELVIGAKGQTQEMECQGSYQYPWSETDAGGRYLAEDITSVRIEGKVRLTFNASYLFSGLVNAASFDLSGLDTSEVYAMNGMFAHCESVTSLDLSGFDTSQVYSMFEMFSNCHSLKELNLSSFDTKKLGSRWETKNPLSGMFYDCRSLETIDLSGFELPAVEFAQTPFGGSQDSAIRQIKSPALLYVDIPLPFTMYDRSGQAYTSFPKGLIRGITLYKSKEEALAAPAEKVKDITGAYRGVNWKIDQKDILVIGKSGKTQTFSGTGNDWSWSPYAKSIRGVRFEGTVKGSGNMDRLFEGLEQADTIDLKGFRTGNVTSMALLFSMCGVNSLDLSGFDTSKVTNMSFMFESCRDLKALDVSGFNTSKVTDMSGMFCGCSGVKKLDLRNFDTRRVTDMSLMFSQCSAARTIDVSSFRTPKVTTVAWMFERCRSLTELDLSGFRTDRLTTWAEMVSGCEKLVKLDISSFNTKKTRAATDGGDDPSPIYVFHRCSSLKYIALGKNTVTKYEPLPRKGWVRYKSLSGKSVSTRYIRDLKNYTGKYPGWYRYTTKKSNPMTVKTSTKTVKARSLKKSSRTLRPITVRKNKGPVKYSRVSGSKKLRVNTKTGKITVTKGTKKGTYRMKVKVRAAGNKTYLYKTRIVTVKIIVK